MNVKEELAKEALSIIQSSKVSIVKGIDMAIKEKPEIISEILEYSMIKSCFLFFVYIVFFLILFKIGLIILKEYKIKKENADLYEDFIGYEICIAGLFIPSFIFLLLLISKIILILKIFIAPRIFLIEYFSNLIK